MNNKIKCILDCMRTEYNEELYENDYITISDNLILLRKENDNCDFYTLNKYQFQHLCKEFMKEQQLCVWSGNGYNKSISYECSITHFMFGDVKTYKADTEFEAIINATYAVIKGEVQFT